MDPTDEVISRLARGGFDIETEILSDVGFIKFADFDKLLYRVAVASGDHISYRKVLAYTIGTYTGDNVRLSTAYGDIFVTPATKFVSENGLVDAGSLVGLKTGIMSTLAPDDDGKFLQKLQDKYVFHVDGYRYRFRVESSHTASILQAKSTVSGYAATISGRTITIRTGKRYIRCICAEFTSSAYEMWNVLVDSDPALIFIRRNGAVFMVYID